MKINNIAMMGFGILIGASLSFGMVSAGSDPGSSNDPLVTQSYVENRIEEIESDYSKAIEKMEAELGEEIELLKGDETSMGNGIDIVEGNTASYIIVELEAGTEIYFGENTEFILRGGKASAIQSENGGLSDLTDGYDISGGENVVSNHLILVPRNDGRGLSIEEKSWVMVKGNYSIVE